MCLVCCRHCGTAFCMTCKRPGRFWLNKPGCRRAMPCEHKCAVVCTCAALWPLSCHTFHHLTGCSSCSVLSVCWDSVCCYLRHALSADLTALYCSTLAAKDRLRVTAPGIQLHFAVALQAAHVSFVWLAGSLLVISHFQSANVAWASSCCWGHEPIWRSHPACTLCCVNQAAPCGFQPDLAL